MKCKNCGNELSDDSLFCPECGTKVETSDTPVESEAEAVNEEAAPQAEKAAPKKGNHGLIVLGIIAVVVIALLAVLVVVGVKLFAGNQSVDDKALVYIKDDALYYTDNMDKEKEAWKVTDLKGADDDYRYRTWLNLTESGKYIYFYSSFNSDGNGTLCRIRTSKISKDEDKNENAVEKINTNVKSYSLIDDDTFLYKKGEDKLYYFNGKEDVDIAKNVSAYRYLKDEKAVLYVGGTKKELCLYNLKKGESETIGEKDVYYLVNSNNTDFIVYYKSVEYTTDEGYTSNRTDYYYTDLKGNGEKIDSGVYMLVGVDADNSTIYYIKKEQIGGSLYDFIDDTYADGKKMEEPDIKDFLETCSEYDAMSDYDRDYYSRYPEYKERYFYNWLNRDNTTGMKYTAHYVTLEDGSSVYTYFYYDENDGQWYVLDQKSYEDAVQKYRDYENVENLRQNLKDYNYSVDRYDLYRMVKGSKPECLVEGINEDSLRSSVSEGLFVYEKATALTDVKIDIAEFNNVYSAYDLVNQAIHPEYYSTVEDLGMEAELYYYMGSEKQLDTGEFGKVTSLSNVKVSQDGKQVVVTADGEDTNNVLYTISNGELKDPIALDEDVYQGSWVENTFYFYIADDLSDTEADLCKLVKGKSEVVLKRVPISEVVYYAEDNVYAVMDDPEYGGITTSGTLRLYDAKGNDSKVDSDVTNYTYINSKRIVYMQDDDLYIYNGKDKTRRISRNVKEYDCYEQAGIRY